MKKRLRYPLIAAAVVGALGSHAASAAAGPAPMSHTAVNPPLPAPRLSEAAKIQALIHSVEVLPGAVFIRNGSEYDGHKAADHMRMKLKYAGDKVQTAEQFIDLLATGSSMSGKPYHIRFADGRTVESAVFFHEQLRKLEAPSVSKRG